ncbi:PREDICTED: nucleoplasmin-2 [Elephantulus edwardii]|uniref:nucleoplasmin-2 n=1 Tax=Elephantulus edwardii TaxID=28737 RepID=UPI0003F0944E|nr:PREDICTED: nucleoplasmin-2 [Elephantulus edwardii]
MRCELNQDRPVRSFKPQQEDKPNCKLLLSTICLGEKAKEEMNLVEILPMSYQTSKKTPITIASLQASTLPMVSVTGLELSPPVIFQLRAGSGPVFISGQESYEKKAGKRRGGSEVSHSTSKLFFVLQPYGYQE